MISDSVKRIERYAGLGERLKQGLCFLVETDFSSLQDGRYPLEGENLFAVLSTYMTREQNDTPEAHRSYIDIQYLIEGEELIGVAPLENMKSIVKEDPEADLWLYNGESERLTLAGDAFMVFWPTDAHAPCIAKGKPSMVRKCVVKVKI